MLEIKKPDAALAKFLPPASPRPGIKYIPSQYALPFTHGGKDYIFHNLTKQCVEGALPASARAGEGWDELIAAHFLVPENKDECAWYNQISALMRAYSRKKGIRGYTILPTFGCNARCVYCYEEGMKQVTMTPEIEEQVIRYILGTHEGDKVKLSWFGGEPLLGVRTIDRVCEGMREAGLDYKSSMISNGSLITPEIVKKMASDWNLSHIQISMDGADGDECPSYVANIRDGASVGFKYFDCQGVKAISIRTRAYADGFVAVKTAWDGEILCRLRVHYTNIWTEATAPVELPDGVNALYFTFEGEGAVSLASFTLHKEDKA